ncbi:MAG: signal recognition particle-docking protein FtsY [Anaerolineales bacterium]
MTSRLRSFTQGLTRTRQQVFGRIANAIGVGEISADTWDEIEAILIQADIGVATATELVDSLRDHVKATGLTRADDLMERLRTELRAQLPDPPALTLPGEPTVILMVGVNGSGKTTTAAKLARWLAIEHNARPLLAACDTFRAAAVEQLQIWGARVGVPVIAGDANADPGAVLFDAVSAARARGSNVVIADTAGRLHTRFNLMEELEKVRRVAAKAAEGAPHHVLLVLDAITGQNALAQARAFRDKVGVTGVVVSKLDSSARGGMVFAIRRELALPVQFVGLGEAVEDLQPFEPGAFVDGLFDQ